MPSTASPAATTGGGRSCAQRTSLHLDALLLLLILGLGVPYALGAFRQMTQEPLFRSREGIIHPPPRVDEMMLLHPLPGPGPRPRLTPEQALEQVSAEARRRGFDVQPEAAWPCSAPALLRTKDGDSLLLLARRGSACLVFDPRHGEGVISLYWLEPRLAGRCMPLSPRQAPAADPGQ